MRQKWWWIFVLFSGWVAIAGCVYALVVDIADGGDLDLISAGVDALAIAVLAALKWGVWRLARLNNDLLGLDISWIRGMSLRQRSEHDGGARRVS